MKRTYKIGVKKSLKQIVYRIWSELKKRKKVKNLEWVIVSNNIPFASWASELIIIASESEVKANFKKWKVIVIRPETRWSIYEQAEGFTGGPNPSMWQNTGMTCE